MDHGANLCIQNKMGQVPVDLAYSADVKSVLNLAKAAQNAVLENEDDEEYLAESDPED